MQYSKIIYPIAAILAIFIVSSCGDDVNGVEIREDGKVHVNVGVEMNNVVEVATRASEGYMDFGGSEYDGWVMGVVSNASGVVDKGTATYSYSGTTGGWASDLWLGPATYDFYAYIPYKIEATNVELLNADTAPLLVFSGQPPFATKDLLASVGAKNQGDAVTTGSYRAVVSQNNENQVNFRMNHLLSKLILKFQLASNQYDDLRKIEITSVTLGSDINNSRSYNINCDYSSATMATTFTPAAANASEKASVTFDYDGAGTSLLGGKALALTQTPAVYDYTEGSGGVFYVVPDVVNKNDKKLKLTITYNVFTKDSTTDEYVETRHQVTATNSSLVVCKNAGVATNIEAAKVYTLTVKVVPSYLYMLADVDQSNSIVLN